MDEQKKQKNSKIFNIVINVIVGIILVMALLVTINNITSKKQGYTSMFGTAYMVVQSQSMDGPIPDEYKNIEGIQAGFKKDDLVKVKVLKDADKSKLKEGDIISFRIEVSDSRGGTTVIINSHRIVEVDVTSSGAVRYRTQGDNRGTNPDVDPYWVNSSDISGNGLYCVIGIVSGNAGVIGHVLNFFNTSTGFLVCIVIPSFLVVLFFAYDLIKEILRLRKVGAVEEKAKYEEELLAKLRAQGVQIPADVNGAAPAPEGQAAEQTPAGNDTPTGGEENK